MKHGLPTHFFTTLFFVLLCLSGRAQSADTYTLSTSRIASTSAQLNWTGTNPTPNTTFEVRWRQQGAPDWITISGITGTNIILTDLLDGQTYEWQLRPAGSALWQGGPATFSVPYGCLPPSLQTPNSLSATAAQLSWYFNGSSSPNTPFTLELKTTEATSWSSITNIPNPYNSGGTITVQNLVPGTAYVWRVRGGCSPFSGTATFSTPACAVNDPQHEPLPTSARLRWTTTPGAIYTLQWRPQGGSWTTISGITPGQYASTTDFSLTALTPNSTYEWQVQPVCGVVSGSYTAPLSFSASCYQPTSVSLGTAMPARATISWNTTYSQSYYGIGFVVQYRPKVPADAAWLANTNGGYGTTSTYPYSYQGYINNLTPATAYEARVQTTCPNSVTSDFTSPPISFTTTSCTNTATNLYFSGSTLTSVYLYWSGIYEHLYAVQFRASGTTSWSQVGPPTYTGNTSLHLQGLTAATVYEWRVLTYCSTSASAVSPTGSQTFSTGICATNRVSGLYSTNVGNTSAQVNWSESSPQVGQYVVRYRAVGSTDYVTLPQQTSQQTSLTGLAENTAYEWQVTSVCSESPASYSFSAPQTFTTACPNIASYLRTENNLINAITLRWDNPYLNNTYDRTFLVRYRPQGAEYTTQLVNVNTYSPVLSLTGLQTGTVYEWGVARQCSATSNSAYTNGTSFSTTCRNALNYLQTRNITATRATISFDDFEYRSQYQLRYRVVGTPDWLTVPTTSRTYTLTGLTAGTTYEWQAATQCSSEFISTYTASQTFTASCLVPTGLYASGANAGAYLSWEYNGNVSAYTIQYRLQGTTDWLSVSVTGSSYSLNNLQGRYDWRMRAECGSGVSSDFTPISTFATYCNTPYSLAASALSSYGATISWVGSDPSRYNLQWRPSGTSAWNTATDIYQPNYVLTGLTDQTTYEIQVQAQCGTNNASNFSSSLTVAAACSPPTGLSSLGMYSYESVPFQDFSWNTTQNMAYNLRWRPITGDNQTPADWEVASDIQPSSRQFLTIAGTYEWQVQGVCVNGSRSAYVGGKPFVVSDCETKYITYNRTVVEATQALLSYEAFVNADVRWRAVGSPDWNTVANVGVHSGVSIKGLTENTAYEWQVRVHCLSGQTADYGPLQTFTTTCAPPTRLTTTCVGPTQASLAWAGPVGTYVYDAYEIQWRPVGTTNWLSVQVEGAIHSLTGLSSATNYEWRVRAVCSASANAGFSPSQSFYTQCTQPNALTAQTQCGSATLYWQGGCDYQTRYTVRVRVNYGSWVDYATTDRSYSLYNLPSGATVEYQVQSSCNGVNSLFSSSYYVYMPSCPAPASCSIVSNLTQTVSSDQATLTWRTTSSASELRWRVLGGNWNSVTVSGTIYNLAGLANNSLYEWKVRSGCAGPSDFSSVSFFRTRCDGTIYITTLVGGPESVTLYVYKPVPYELRYRVGNGSWTNRTVTSNVFTLTGLLANTRYEMQFRNACSDGSVSDWMPSRFITTTCPVLSRVFADRLTESSVRVNWGYAQSPTGFGLVLKYRPYGQTDWTTLPLTASAQINPAAYTLTNLSPQTTYEWLIQFDCGNVSPAPVNNQPLTFRTTGNASPCASMTTLVNGDWTNPSVWSCGRVPTPADDVQVLHQVMIPDRAVGRALRVRYGEGGSIRFGTGGRLLLGQ